MTKWGKDAQLDFSAELAKARASGADGIFVFYPGPAGPAFAKQYEQAGLVDQIPLYTVFTVDSISLPRLQQAGLKGVVGSLMTQFWVPDLDFPQNRKFVSAFREKHGRYPSFYAAQSYDTIFFIKSAVEAVDGNLEDMGGLRAAMAAADFPPSAARTPTGTTISPSRTSTCARWSRTRTGTGRPGPSRRCTPRTRTPTRASARCRGSSAPNSIQPGKPLVLPGRPLAAATA